MSDLKKTLCGQINDTTSFEDPPEQDMNERSVSSSMYRTDEHGEITSNY